MVSIKNLMLVDTGNLVHCEIHTDALVSLLHKHCSPASWGKRGPGGTSSDAEWAFMCPIISGRCKVSSLKVPALESLPGLVVSIGKSQRKAERSKEQQPEPEIEV